MTSNNYTLPLRVYVEDTDFGGVVYHSKYLNFMERARTEWLITLGFDLAHFEALGCYFVVRTVNVDYHRAAKINDELFVQTELFEIGNSSLTFHHTISNARMDGLIYCTGTVKLVCVNPNLKPIRIPTALREILSHE